LVSERETFGPNSGGVTSGDIGRFAFLLVSKQFFVGLHLKHYVNDKSGKVASTK